MSFNECLELSTGLQASSSVSIVILKSNSIFVLPDGFLHLGGGFLVLFGGVSLVFFWCFGFVDFCWFFFFGSPLFFLKNCIYQFNFIYLHNA